MTPLLQALAGDTEIAELLSDEAQLASMLAFEAALAAAEADAGLISETTATAIAEGIAKFAPDWADLAAGMARDGVVVPALIAQLRQAIDPAHAAELHRGATSQDVVDTALMLQLARIIPILLGRITKLDQTFAALAEQYGAQPLMAHTRMQAALPFTVADKVRTWSEPLARHRTALSSMRRELLVIQLGGPIGDRSSFDRQGDVVARHLATRLDLGLAAPWHSTRDPIIMLGARLATLTGSLGKLGADIALMVQTEIGAVRLEASGTSSAMTHKANPVSAELLVALAHYTAGLSGTLNHAMIHEGERSGSAWTLEWLVVPSLILATGASLLRAQLLLAGLSFAHPNRTQVNG
jgi:3-carboxy-cis,cis-muconate cycloisomerase